ncbi:MAG: nitroreductase family protein [Candidatus Margulisbacteria bacterium]|nr:nitroreductase family protein [Candidatus Margulisiibacteriota bacterium]
MYNKFVIIKEIIKRRSNREYLPDEIEEDVINEIIKSAQFAPTGMNNRSVEFMVIRNYQTKENIFKLIGQEFIKQAPALIIPVIDTGSSVTPIQDLSIASSFILLQATALELGSVWKNVRIENRDDLKKLLGIPDSYEVINVIPIGYVPKTLAVHQDSEYSEEKIHWDNW